MHFVQSFEKDYVKQEGKTFTLPANYRVKLLSRLKQSIIIYAALNSMYSACVNLPRTIKFQRADKDVPGM